MHSSTHSRRSGWGSEAGFSLAEMVVSVSVLGILAAATIPAVGVQLKKSEVASVAETLTTIDDAIAAFYSDTNRWPSEYNQLIHEPGRTDGVDGQEGLNGASNQVLNPGNNSQTIPPGQLKKWKGPYLDIGAIPEGRVKTPLDGTIERDFEMICIDRNEYLIVRIAGVTQEDAKLVSLDLDEEDVLTYDAAAAGRVQWQSPNRLVYLAAAVSPPKCNY